MTARHQNGLGAADVLVTSFGENINSQEEEHTSTNAYFRPIMVHYAMHTAPIIIFLEMQLNFYPKRNISDDICPDLYKVEGPT